MPEKQEWIPCRAPAIGDTLRWTEPLWAAPNKPRGKPDKIGEQQVTARLMAVEGVLEFQVLSVTKLSPGDAPLKVKEGDTIRRKQTTLDQGACCKLIP